MVFRGALGEDHQMCIRDSVTGEDVVFHSTKDAERKGIAMIYQEFNMVRDLSVAENMYLGRLPKTSYGAVDWKKLYKDCLL